MTTGEKITQELQDNVDHTFFVGWAISTWYRVLTYDEMKSIYDGIKDIILKP